MSRKIERTCGLSAEELTAFALGALEAEEAQRIREHLAGCAACRAELLETESLLDLSRSLPRMGLSARMKKRILRKAALARESANLTLFERARLAAGLAMDQVKTSSRARILLLALAAQLLILVGLAVLADRISILTTPIPRESGAFRLENQRDPEPILPLEEKTFSFSREKELASALDRVRVIEPLSRLPEPPSIGLFESDSLIAFKELDQKIERENRVSLGQFRMAARIHLNYRDRLSSGRGGDRRTERVVARGLRWLSDHQSRDGSWNPAYYGGDERARAGITALCAAAFLSDGHSAQSGKYAATVSDALQWIADQEEGIVAAETDRGLALFNRSASVFALAENHILCAGMHGEVLLGMVERLASRIKELRKPAAGSIAIDDFAGTWAAMALRTALMAGLELPGLSEAARAAEEQVALLARGEGDFRGPISASLPPLYSASEVALGALFRPEKRLHESGGLPFPDLDAPWTLFALLDDPETREPSFLFFIGTALCEGGGPLWTEWNQRLKPLLAGEQEEDGLWLAGGDWPWIDGGDLYTTALHLLTLQVYYRYIKLEENCQ